MSPAPRKLDDDALLAATARVLARLGPARATVRAIAAEVGLSAGRLVQRFGSKRSLLLAVLSLSAEATRARFRQLRASHASPLAAIRAWADGLARIGDSPDALTHHLALLQLEQTDPEFRASASRDALEARAGLRDLVCAAVDDGELVATAAADGGDALARRIQVAVGGSLFAWATLRQGSSSAWVREDLDALLEPYEAGGGETE